MGIWLILRKKSDRCGTGLDYNEILETAICYGWIDARRKSAGEAAPFLQRFTPRGKRSIWSKIKSRQSYRSHR